MGKFVYSFNEGSKDMRDLLGGKGANLAEMTKIGLPVPFGFTISTDACKDYLNKGGMLDDEIVREVYEHLDELEQVMGKKFGDIENPLLVSVRSGAPVSMPGMMDTILNLGLNDDSVKGLAAKTGNERFAYDSYRRFIQMFGDVVMEIPKSKFDQIFDGRKKEVGAEYDVDLKTEDLKVIIEGYKELVKAELGREFPQNPKDQLMEAIQAVFRSWNNERAILYRKLNNISASLGTAVNVQSMVFGNTGENSGTGVAFTRSPVNGENKIFAICNCNVNVCYALRTSQLFNTPNLSRSAYVAKVEKDKCVACGRCVEVCPAGAAKLGQKLCSKKAGGQVPEYPRQELPDATKWDHTKWSPNYRNDNRIETHESGTAPCKTACPAHVAVQGYLKLAAQGRYDEALALIKRENPLPAICGRVCNRRCEDACTRGRVDAAVAIDEVKKFIAQRDLDAATRYVPPVVTPTRAGGFDQKVAIIGAGPAGLSCAFYLAEKGYKPVVFEKNERPGGMLTYGIPSFKLQKDVIEAEVEVIRLMGAEFRYGVEVGRDVTLDELREQGFKAFYVAIGCQGGRFAGIPGEDAEDVTVAVDFLREVNSGKIDALPGRTIVVGGGNVAIDVARNACRLGSEHVEMFCLESEAQMPASEEERREAVEDGAHISCGWGPKEVHLDEAGRVCGITFKRCTRVFDDEGRFAPEYDENDLRRVDADRVVMSIGQSIVWGDLLAGSKVELGRGQGALADPQTYQTAEPDIFVGGDVYTGPSFAIDAIAAGHEAAVSIHRFVQPGSTLTIGRNQRRYTALDRDDVVIESYDNASREVAHVDREREKAAPFSEYVETFTEEQVRAETARCLGCGASIVDPNKCIGCGLCTTRCEFDAIHLQRDMPEASRMYRTEDKMKAILPHMIKRAAKITIKDIKEKCAK